MYGWAKGRNGTFKVIRLSAWMSSLVQPRSMYLDIASSHGVPVECELHIDDARKLADAILAEIGGEILFGWSEGDLAIEYAKAACPKCQEGECELGGDEHDLSVYWNLAADMRAEIKGRVIKAMVHCTANEVLADAVSSVVDEAAATLS
jgi:hypothetical protein